VRNLVVSLLILLTERSEGGKDAMKASPSSLRACCVCSSLTNRSYRSKSRLKYQIINNELKDLDNMSRIGKKPILIPSGIEVEINDGRIINIKGPKGEISQVAPEGILLRKENNQIIVELKDKMSKADKSKKISAFWGLSRALIQNHFIGLTSGFEKKLEIKGVGYRATIQGEKILRLEVGFSHSVELEIPSSLKVSVEKNIIVVSGIGKQEVGEFSAKIRKVRPPEPYKGKGIRYLGEKVKIKEGKKVGATG